VAKAPVTEIYCVITVNGELEDENVRELISAMFDYAAEEILRPGYRGSITSAEDEAGEIEIMIVDSIEAARRELPEGLRWDDDEEPGEA
jgi:hypothetical protein